MTDIALLKERAKFRRLCREYEALLVLLQGATMDFRKTMDQQEEAASTIKKSELRLHIHELELEISRLRKTFAVKASASVLTHILEKVKSKPEDDYLIPKFVVQTLCDRYDKVVKGFDDLPEHTNIGFHSGLRRKDVGEVEIYLVEAKLFEDMCALFNLAKESHARVTPHQQGASKVNIKTNEALYRATVTTSFYFLESYLNGLAYDYYVVKNDDLDEDTKKILTEWDNVKNRPYYLSLRDKVLQYPRIIIGLDHPPIQESNCPELAYLAGRVKVLRDAIVHPSPGPNLTSFEPGKEKELFHTDFAEVERIVDTAIALVRKIERTVRGDERRISWLKDRSATGLFSDEVFR